MLSKTTGSKKFGEYLILKLSFQRDAVDFSLMSDGFFLKKIILTKARRAHSCWEWVNNQNSPSKQKGKPSKDIFGKLQFLPNCWIPLRNRKQPNQVLHIPHVDPNSLADSTVRLLVSLPRANPAFSTCYETLGKLGDT